MGSRSTMWCWRWSPVRCGPIWTAAGNCRIAPLVAQIPVSTRTDATAVGNAISSMTVSLPTEVADPAERIRAVLQGLAGGQADGRGNDRPPDHGADRDHTAGPVPAGRPRLHRQPLGENVPPINLVVSNVPGPPFPLYAAGAVLEQFTPIGPLLMDVGLNITCFSYRDWMDFGFVSTPEIADDIGELADAIEPALAELERAAATAPSPRAAGRERPEATPDMERPPSLVSRLDGPGARGPGSCLEFASARTAQVIPAPGAASGQPPHMSKITTQSSGPPPSLCTGDRTRDAGAPRVFRDVSDR